MPHTSPSPDTAATLQTLGVRVLVRGWLSANNLVFRAGQGQAGGTVVDTGYLSHAEQTHALIDSALGGTPLAEVVNTHLHSESVNI
jgi:glyoxylase-like metal-dependent hydrolase (beta-lactamase superfamily II)